MNLNLIRLLINFKSIIVLFLMFVNSLSFSQASLDEDEYVFKNILLKEYKLIQNEIWKKHGNFIKNQILGDFKSFDNKNLLAEHNFNIKLLTNSKCSKLNTPLKKRLSCLDNYNPEYSRRFRTDKDSVKFHFEKDHLRIVSQVKSISKPIYSIDLPYNHLIMNDYKPESKLVLKTCNSIRLKKESDGSYKSPQLNLYNLCKIDAKKEKNSNINYTKLIKESIKYAVLKNQKEILENYIKNDKKKLLELYNYDDFYLFTLLNNEQTYRLLNNILCHNNFIALNKNDIQEMKRHNYPVDLIDKLIIISSLRSLLHQQNWYFFNQDNGNNYSEISRYLSEDVSPQFKNPHITWRKISHQVSHKIETISKSKYNRNLNYWDSETLDMRSFQLNAEIGEISVNDWMTRYPISYFLVNSSESQYLPSNISHLFKDHTSLMIACNLYQTDSKNILFKNKALEYINKLKKKDQVDYLCVLASNGYDDLWDEIIFNFKIEDIDDEFYRSIYADIGLLKQRTLAFSFIEYQAFNEKETKLSRITGIRREFEPNGIKYFKVISGIPYQISPYNSPKMLELIDLEKAISIEMIGDLYDSSGELRSTMTNFFDYIMTPYSYAPIGSTKEDAIKIEQSNAKKSESFEKWMTSFSEFSLRHYSKNQIEKKYFDRQNDWLNTIYIEYGHHLTRVVTNEHSQHARGMKNKKNYSEWNKI